MRALLLKAENRSRKARQAGSAALCLLWMATAAGASGLTHQGTVEWDSEDVSGVSGLEVSADGLSFAAVGDRGWFLEGRIERANGQITAVQVDTILPLLSGAGRPVAARRSIDQADAEGLAMAEDGSFWVSFERWAHVSHYENATAVAGWIEDHPDFAAMRDNRQLEALALHPDGTLYTMPENTIGGSFPVFALKDGAWKVVGQIPSRDGFAIVGADFDADGTLYLLERKLVFGVWWQSQVRRLDLDAPDQSETLWVSVRGEYGNLEGLALWAAPDGLRMVLVSDNNGKKGVPTQFVEFRVED